MKAISHYIPLVILSVFLFGFSACDKDATLPCTEHTVSDCNPDPNKVNIRVKNVSDYNFCNVQVSPYSELSNCGIIKSGELTCYRSYDVAYHYGYIRLDIGEKEFELIPFDYVGETSLAPGYYTYSIGVSDYENSKLTLDFN